MRSLPILSNVETTAPGVSSFSVPANPPWLHLIDGEHPLVFIVEGSQLFEITPDWFEALQAETTSAVERLRRVIGPAKLRRSEFGQLAPPTAVSLNIAQACNLSCSYCYADEGLFGGNARMMSAEVATETIDRLIAEARSRTVTLGFIGGEPFLNRSVLHETVAYAKEKARAAGIRVRFSVTTNGTLLRADDIELLRDNAFAVSVSLDGAAAMNDRHRRRVRGSGSYTAVTNALEPFLRNPGNAKIAARATVARDDLRVVERIEALTSIGFREVGISPLRTSPDPLLIMQPADWPVLLKSMIQAAEVELERVWHRQSVRFSNFAIALKEIHRGACRPLPCGAGANYVSVSADGDYFTCHRTIDNPTFLLGNRKAGPLDANRSHFLTMRHVDRQEPCSSCWARYLCGGGCHAEVVANGRAGCDYIRGWLEFCLSAYNKITLNQPDFFEFDHEVQS